MLDTSDVEFRSKGIGGSQIAAILGMDNPGKDTPYTVWRRIMGIDKQKEANERMIVGQVMEPYVIGRFERETGFKVIDQQRTFRKGIAQCHIDGLAVNSDGEILYMVEAKTVSAPFARKEWDIEVPDYPRLQSIWNCGLAIESGIELKPLIKVPVMFGFNDSDYAEYEVAHEHDCYELAREEAERFWRNYVITKIPPPAINERDAKLRWAQSKAKVMQCGADLAEVVRLAKDLTAEIKEKEEALANYKATIAISMDDCDTLVFSGSPIVTYKSQATSKWDEDAFVANNPDLARQYIMTALDKEAIKKNAPEIYKQFQGQTRVLRFK